MIFERKCLCYYKILTQNYYRNVLILKSLKLVKHDSEDAIISYVTWILVAKSLT